MLAVLVVVMPLGKSGPAGREHQVATPCDHLPVLVC